MLYKKRCDNVLILYDKHKVTFKTVQRQYLLTLWGRPLQRRVRRVRYWNQSVTQSAEVKVRSVPEYLTVGSLAMAHK